MYGRLLVSSYLVLMGFSDGAWRFFLDSRIEGTGIDLYQNIACAVSSSAFGQYQLEYGLIHFLPFHSRPFEEIVYER